MERDQLIEKLEKLLLDYCGDNIGAKCGCGTCERERQPMREFVMSIIDEVKPLPDKIPIANNK